MRRRVVVVWLAFAVLSAIVVAVAYRDVMASRAQRGARADAGMLVPVPVEQLGAVEIADAGTLHRFERDAAAAWFYHGAHSGADAGHTHATDAASAGRIDQAFQAFGRARVERRLPAGSDPRTYGVAAPRILILLYRGHDRQPLAQYAVGDVAADTVSRYVDMVGGGGIVTIPTYQIDNLLALVAAVKEAPAAR
jgi:hypothetical protein